MGAMDKLRQAVDAQPQGSGARQIGEVVLMIAEADSHAAEVIAANLDNKDMALDKCFEALREHAQKQQQNGFWGCMCNRFDPDNEVIKVVCGFYHVSPECGTATPPAPVQPASTAVDLLDLL